MQDRPRKAAARLLVAVFSFLVALAIGEGILRALRYRYVPLRIVMERKNDARGYHAFKDENFAYDPVLIWRPKNNHGVFNAQGFRGRELAAEKPPGEFRIFAVGDSNTLGWADSDGSNWPKDLDDILSSRSPDIIVVNAGVWGYASLQGLSRFKEVLSYKPDLVFISFGSNDAHLVARSDVAYRNAGVFRRWTPNRLLRQLKLGQLMLAVSDRLLPGNVAIPVHRVGLDEYRDNLNEIAQLGRENAARVVFLTRPFTGRLPNDYSWKNFAPAYNATTIEVGEANQLPVIDVYAFFESKRKYFQDECHFNRDGNRLMAELLAERISHLLPVTKPGS